MARDKKFGGRKNVKCSLCGKTFKAARYLKQHMEVHKKNNNNNNKNKYNNKNILKKFIKFIIKIIIIINNEFDILNYVGDKEDQRRAIYNLKHEVPDTEFCKKIVLIEDGPIGADGMVNDMAKDKDAFKLCSGAWGSDIDEKVAEYKRILNKKRAEEEQEKKEIEEENKKYEDIIKYISKFGAPKKNNELGDIKIKRKIIEAIAEQKKEKMVRAVENKIKDIAEKENENKKEDEKIDINNIKIGPKEEPMVAYEANFLYPKISARQLFNQTVPDEKIKKFIINYINKKYVDYPTDKEIEEEMKLAYSHYTRTLSGNGLYKEKFDALQSKILEYFKNGGESFKCNDCGKYIINKRRHCMHCKEFLKKIDEEGGKLKLKKYIEENYKKIKIEEVELILTHYKGADSKFISKTLPHYIKFRHGIRKKWLKKQKEKCEIAENSMAQTSMIPPVHFNTGLAKKLFEEVTKFKYKKK